MTSLKTVEIPLALDEDCEPCAERLAAALGGHRGIAGVNPAREGSLAVSYDPDECGLDCLEGAAQEARVELAAKFEHRVIPVGGMDCADCARTIERAVDRLPGVSHAAVNFSSAKLKIEYPAGAVDQDLVDAKVRSLGYRVEDGSADEIEGRRLSRSALTGIGAALLATAVLAELAGAPQALWVALYAACIAITGLPIARSGVTALVATRRPGINLLMTIAVIGAAVIGEWLEAGLVVVLFSLGEALEARAVERARRELEGLVALAPEVARLRRPASGGNGGGVEEVVVPVAELRVGDQIVVRPGERIGADGAVAEGASAVDQAPITGESTPVDKAPGDEVFAGTLNAQGALVIEVGTPPGESTLDRVAKLVAEAQERKAPVERWVDRFAAVYTPLVMAAALLVAVVPALLFGADSGEMVYSALALLILACPCALVISTPVSIVTALARSSAAGVLVKGGAHLERAAAIDTVAFDKTGTLTEGRPRLTSVEAPGGDPDDVLAAAAAVESLSEHPLAQAIVAAAREKELSLAKVSDFEALTGIGARGTVEGTTVSVGSPKLLASTLDPTLEATMNEVRERGETAVLVARDSSAVGVLGIADQPRPEAAEAIEELGRLGISRTIMLTGDNETTAQAIAAQLGVAEVRAGLLPEDKANQIAELGAGTAMVGDGVNDAPALAAADLGIAMGSAGSDTAIEVADAALMGDDPRRVAGLIGLARWGRSIVRQNIAFSLLTKLGAAVLLALGSLPLWGAVASDVGASLIVVANGLRLLRGAPRSGRLRGAPNLPPARASRQAAGEPALAADAPEAEGAACCADDDDDHAHDHDRCAPGDVH